MEKLHPKAVWIFFFHFLTLGLGLVFWVIVLMLVWAAVETVEMFEFKFNWWIVILFAVIWIFGSYVWAKLYYDNYKFELTEEAFKKEYGVIWKHYVSIPYEKIQNVDIHRGILARILDLSELKIQTAGYAGISYEGELPGLSKERAEEIRDELIKRAKGAKSRL